MTLTPDLRKRAHEACECRINDLWHCDDRTPEMFDADLEEALKK